MDLDDAQLVVFEALELNCYISFQKSWPVYTSTLLWADSC